MTKMQGRNFCFTLERPPICSFTRVSTKSWINSTKDCPAFGTKFPPFLVTKWTRSKTEPMVSSMNKGEFVNEKYKFPIFMGINGIMANCSSGLFGVIKTFISCSSPVLLARNAIPQP